MFDLLWDEGTEGMGMGCEDESCQLTDDDD